MELTPRKQAVLKAIVKAYIETGEPIGSKNLTLLLQNAPSSATLRNEMSDLCELGFLEQPHTSAGRVPTSKGYKLYVNSLMAEPILNANTLQIIESSLNGTRAEPESIPSAVAKVVSDITGLPAVYCLVAEKMPRVKKIELLPIGRFSKMLLVITDDGRTRNRILRQGKDFTQDIEKCYYDLIEKYIKGKTVDTLTKAYMQTVVAKAGIYSLELMPLFASLFESAADFPRQKVKMLGKEHLYNIYKDEKAAKIISFFNNTESAISLFDNVNNNAEAIFGTDTDYPELFDNTIIAAKFLSGEKYKGYIGVIGPKRMSYEQIIPCIEYTAKKLTEIMTEAQKDMED